MYLDIFKEKSQEENFRGLQAYVLILSSIIMSTVIISEFADMSSPGITKAITMMVGFWLFCSAFQNHLQKITYPARIIIYLLLLVIQWFVIFIYFVEKY
jgi:hypothetical protein